MTRQQIHKAVVRIIIVIAALYVFILIWDMMFPYKPGVSVYFKFMGIALCTVISFIVVGDAISHNEAMLASAALFFTFCADYFILFSSSLPMGMAVFCIPHILRIKIFYKKNFLRIMVMGCVIAGVLFCIALFIMRLPLYFPIGCVYGVFITMALIGAFRNKNFPRINSIFIRLGMVLFVLCDICVMFMNIFPNIAAEYYIIIWLIWAFYLPSQVLLAIMEYSVPKAQ